MLGPWLRHYAKRALGRPSAPPPVEGVADAAWYDAAYRYSRYHEPAGNRITTRCSCVIADH